MSFKDNNTNNSNDIFSINRKYSESMLENNNNNNNNHKAHHDYS